MKSVQTQDLEGEQNDIARHAGHLEVKNAAAKLNERSQSAEDVSWILNYIHQLISAGSCMLTSVP